MKVFDAYASYYDLLYRDKDYAGEADYVEGLIRKHHPGARTILDLGCGTGSHAFLFAQRGFEVTGVDGAATMIEGARKKTDKRALHVPVFIQGDVRDVRLDRKFDVVLALFHVMSYQATGRDMEKALTTVAAHLNIGGLFVFDCWHGPAVLAQRPGPRTKELEDDAVRVIREAVPVWKKQENLVEVNYRVTVYNKDSGEETMIRESHRMRYWFTEEVMQMISRAGISNIFAGEWMTGKPIGEDTWNACYVNKCD